MIGEDERGDQVRHVRAQGKAGESIAGEVERCQRGQARRQGEIGQQIALEKERVTKLARTSRVRTSGRMRGMMVFMSTEYLV